MRIDPRALISRVALIGGAATFVWLLEWSYVNLVSPAYLYDGFGDNPADASYRIAAGILAIIPALWMPIRISRPSQMLLWFLYVSVLIPSCVVPFHARATDPLGLLWLCTCIVICIAILQLFQTLPLLRLPRLKTTPTIYLTITAVLSLTFYAFIIGRFGLSLNLVSLESIYDVRDDYTKALAGTSSLVMYSLSWQGNVMNMLLISLGLARRNPVLLGMGVMGQLFLFSITGFKSLLFSCVICILILTAMHHRARHVGTTITWGVVSMTGLTAGMRWLFPESGAVTTFLAVFLQRTIAMPGLLTGDFYDFYSNNPPAYLGYSILRSFVSYPYGLEPARLIGKLYFGNPDTSANAHIWADAYCNFRIPGVFAATIVLAVFCWLYDSCARDRNLILTTLMLAIPSLSLCNSGLLTTLLTHGLGLTLVMVYLLPDPSTTLELSNRPNLIRRLLLPKQEVRVRQADSG